MKIAVIGAGISGLACAYELRKAGHDVQVYEKNDYVGGRMSSRVKDGLIFDIGVDHLTNNYREMKQYCKELGLEWEKMKFLEYRIFRNGNLYKSNDAIGFWSKLRMSLLWFIAPKGLDYFDLNESAKYDTENGGRFVKRWAGQEVVDYLFNAYCAAYQFHLADEVSKAAVMDTLCSLKYEFPEWYLHRIKGGMKALPDALATKLNVRLSTAVTEVKYDQLNKIVVQTSVDEAIYDHVVLACTADVTRKIFVDVSESQKEFLDTVRYASCITVSLRVDLERLKNKPSTVWVPFVENGKIASYVNESYKGDDCIQDGKSTVSVWLHQGWAEELMKLSDQDIFSTVKNEFLNLCPWFDDVNQMEDWDLQRWPVAEPKFYDGYVSDAKVFLDQHQGEKGVWFCGDYLNAPWAEGALRMGKRLAEVISNDQ
jgi:oxygen-dependent protoporphyrinogen oxidase